MRVSVLAKKRDDDAEVYVAKTIDFVRVVKY